MNGNIPRREELLLWEHITGKPRAELLLNQPQLPDAQRRAFFDAAERRKAGEPLQYILGEWDFYGLKFKVDTRALIPRGETELLVEQVVEWAKMNKTLGAPPCGPNRCSRRAERLPQAGSAPNPRQGTRPLDPYCLRILDICTGSGCIVVTLTKILQDAGIAVDAVATDISADALALAAENAALHGVAERVRFVRGDLAEGVAGVFDMVVSNPPYIPSGELAGLQTEVRDYEPRLALDGGADGMDLYRRLLPQAVGLLRPGGGLFLEIGPVGVAALVAEAGFVGVRVREDYAGLARVVTAGKNSQTPARG